VQVINRLPAIFALIHDQSVAIRQAFLLGDLSSCVQKVLVLTIWWNCGHPRDFVLRHDQNVDRCLRLNIAESEDVFVFVDDICRNFALENSRKEGRHIAIMAGWGRRANRPQISAYAPAAAVSSSFRSSSRARKSQLLMVPSGLPSDAAISFTSMCWKCRICTIRLYRMGNRSKAC